ATLRGKTFHMLHLLADLKKGLTRTYTVERELGRGGMASVFLATDLRHSRQVAIKVIRPEIALSVGVGRFLREIGIAARLNHPHIIPVYDSGEAAGLMYYVMPYVPGESLHTRLVRAGRLEIDEAVQIAHEVAGALAHAHSQHVVHRDIKPPNILLADGHAIVVDFGIARAIGEVSRESITAPGIAVGTPTYMSPEQASGERHLDGRSDIYSLGCVLYEMLVGEPPYNGATPHAIITQCFSKPIPSARQARSEIADYLDRALTRALGRLPEDRFQTAVEFAEALVTPQPIHVVTPQLKSIAVLPFLNIGSDVEDAFFSDGITEEIITALSRLRGIRVAARTSSFGYRGTELPITQVGRELDVATVLEGSVLRIGDRLRVTAQLTGVEHGRLLWSEQFDREMRDVFAIQDEIAEAIVTTLRGRFATPHEQFVRRYTENVEAYELYLKGRYAGKTRRRSGLLKGIRYFERAIAADPDYAIAHAGVADSYSLLAWYRYVAPREAFPKATVAAMRALELDDLLPEAHTSRGTVRFYYDRDWNAADRSLHRALELDPSHAPALHTSGELLASRGRLDAALVQANRAQKAEPLALNVNAGVGWIHYFAREWDAAIDQFQRTIELDPDYVFVHWFLGQAYLASGDVEAAIATLRRGVASSDGHPAMKAYLGHAYARAGAEDEARALLQDLTRRAADVYVAADYFAVIHLGLRQHQAALMWLEHACRERSLHLVFLGVDPLFDPIRAEPRFRGILQSVGLQ
ncbi:MAG: tetratricopeptide repeat-containing serine/threonine-protein kinase, partial [Gemmatimonadota bacterium]|nr:tetratricopeptide repeat-containing serine/threonine-protein kinase [Gemmatimonadota bacterium]